MEQGATPHNKLRRLSTRYLGAGLLFAAIALIGYLGCVTIASLDQSKRLPWPKYISVKNLGCSLTRFNLGPLYTEEGVRPPHSRYRSANPWLLERNLEMMFSSKIIQDDPKCFSALVEDIFRSSTRIRLSVISLDDPKLVLIIKNF